MEGRIWRTTSSYNGLLERVKCLSSSFISYHIVALFEMNFHQIIQKFRTYWKIEATYLKLLPFLPTSSASASPAATTQQMINTVENSLPDTLLGLDKDLVEIELAKLGYTNPLQEINRLIDCGFLYLAVKKDVTYEELQFSIPCLLSSFMLGEGDDLILFSSSLLMIYNQPEVNAGKPLERLLRKRIHLLPDETFSRCHEKELVINETACHIRNESDALVSNILSFDDLQPFTNQMLRWKNEIGVDGVQLTVSSSSAKTLSVDVWQCQGGYYEHSIGGGDMETFREIYQRDLNVSKINDSYMNGILTKVEVGMLT